MLCRGLVGVVLLVALLGLLAAHTWTGYTARRPPRVALVLFGGRFESLELTGKSIIQNVIRVLDPDIFAAGNDFHNASGVFADVMRGQRVVHAMFTSQMSRLQHIAHWAPHDSCHRFECGTVEQSFPLAEMQSVEQSFPPRFEYIMMEQATHVVESHERVVGRQYDWIFFLRPDYYWMAPHPGMARLLAQPHGHRAVWFTTRIPWGGVPGGAILMPRHVAVNYWREPQILAVPQRPCAMYCSEETLHKRRMVANGATHFGWYGNVAALVCPKTLCRPGQDHCWKGTLCKPGSLLKYRTVRWWYESEMAEARARRVVERGWNADDFQVDAANMWQTFWGPYECRQYNNEEGINGCVFTMMLKNEAQVTRSIKDATPDYLDAIVRANIHMDTLEKMRRRRAVNEVLASHDQPLVKSVVLPHLRGIRPPSFDYKCSQLVNGREVPC